MIPLPSLGFGSTQNAGPSGVYGAPVSVGGLTVNKPALPAWVWPAVAVAGVLMIVAKRR